MLCQLSYIGSYLERETGIEPATNSLEGCDSTTELLPRTCIPNRKNSAYLLVAREGFEPSKPLGRQIYSLLRLTAPQPRQLSSSAAAPRQTRCSVHEYQDAQLFRGDRLSRRYLQNPEPAQTGAGGGI